MKYACEAVEVLNYRQDRKAVHIRAGFRTSPRASKSVVLCFGENLCVAVHLIG